MQQSSSHGVWSQSPSEVTGRSYAMTWGNNSSQSVGTGRFPAGPAALGGGFEPHWYALITRSRHEKTVGDLLLRKRIETFLPLYETIRCWKNGHHRVELPLFPGYAFVRIALRERLHVLKVPGVVRMVGFASGPTPLEDSEVESLRHALSEGVKAVPHPYLAIGHRVRITAGALAGRAGVLLRKRGDASVVLSLDLIQRSVLLSVNADWLEPAG